MAIGFKMKIRTANNDRYASADVDYQPSLCFQTVADHLNYGCNENDKDIYDVILRGIALFTDILEVVNLFSMSSEIEGLQMEL